MFLKLKGFSSVDSKWVPTEVRIPWMKINHWIAVPELRESFVFLDGPEENTRVRVSNTCEEIDAAFKKAVDEWYKTQNTFSQAIEYSGTSDVNLSRAVDDTREKGGVW